MDKLKFSISWIIGVGFGVLILFILFVNLKTVLTLEDSTKVNKEIVEVHSPSVDALQELKIQILQSKALINHWVNSDLDIRDANKQELIKLIENSYPELKDKIYTISQRWSREDILSIDEIFSQVGLLFSNHEVIKQSLQSTEDYRDPFLLFTAQDYIAEQGEITVKTNQIIELLDKLIAVQRDYTKKDTKEMVRSFADLEFFARDLGIVIILLGIIIAFLTIRSIVRPVTEVKNQLIQLGKGIIPEKKMKPRGKEIGEMAKALNQLLDGFTRTKEFATQVGSGNFHANYEPLSDQDTLGHSLLRMRQDLHELTSDLEQKVLVRTEKIGEQKKEIEVLLKHTTDSIVYAKRIQEAILPSDQYVRNVLPDSFFFYIPKDIVSGDFYWVHNEGDEVFFGAIDCTGHGVPGAFMTIIGHNGLARAVRQVENLTPAKILDVLNQEVQATFEQAGDGASIKDGMDAAICSINNKTLELQYAGAYNPLFYVRNNELHEIRADKFPVGAQYTDEKKHFTNHSIQLQKDDVVYIFSDGYADQFGGPRGKKFMYRKFRELLINSHHLHMSKQEQILRKEFLAWKGDLEQVDDILVIGLRV